MPLSKILPLRSVLFAFLLTLGFAFDAGAARAQAPSCTATGSYGTRTTRLALESATASGTASDVVTAVNNGKAAKGVETGCPDTSYSYTQRPNTRPSLSDVETTWNTVHAPGIRDYADPCPAVARDFGARALGGYYARIAGYDADLGQLQTIGTRLVDTQYSPQTVDSPTAAVGSLGYVDTDSSDPCYLQSTGVNGVLGADVQKYCQTAPDHCVTYDHGQFAGRTFEINDIGIPDVLSDGAIGYDQGWGGVLFVESALQQTDPATQDTFRAAADLAGQWATQENAVRNENYTAKLVWLLAELYDRTGEARWHDAMVDKIERDVKPGVLMDRDGDGIVDGTDGLTFASLTPVAQVPGRMWDGHNARPQYGPINAWALIEAYVAFRDRGDTAEAADLRPYVDAMLDNISNEIELYGVPSDGKSQIPIALLLGLWKISAYEGESHPNWESSAWRLWNGGVANQFGAGTTAAGLYLVYLSGTPYVPLGNR